MTDPIRSLRLRLVLAAIVTILAALSAAGWGLTVLFEHHLERRVINSLQNDIGELIAGLDVADDGAVTLARRPVDPRYLKPFGGSYWQVRAQREVVHRSRSLWDETLPLPADEPGEGQHEHVVSGPRNQSLIAVERAVRVARASGDLEIRFVAARDRAETLVAVAAFTTELAAMLVILGTALLAAFAVAIAVGLSPLGKLRKDLSALRSGASDRLTDAYPAEVALLVDDLNALLDERDRDTERKRQRAADLAHGLKTPLTAISGIAEDLTDRGLDDLADELEDYTASMLRHVERELALARSTQPGSRALRTRVRPVVEALARTLARLPGGRDLDWHIDVPETLHLRIEPTALAEVLGGPLDNARKFARSRVSVRASSQFGIVRLEIADDGPGVSDDQLAMLGERGRRLDSRSPGSGLGLAIASDILAEMGGELAFANAPAGGLEVTLSMPAEG
jgi:signal transduction histidine kinase